MKLSDWIGFAVAFVMSALMSRWAFLRGVKVGLRQGRDEMCAKAGRELVLRLIPLFKAYNIPPEEVRDAVNTPVEIIDVPPLKN